MAHPESSHQKVRRVSKAEAREQDTSTHHHHTSGHGSHHQPSETKLVDSLCQPDRHWFTYISGQSWCIASRTSIQAALQVALDHACGYGGADCSMIQPGSNCYSSDSVQDHASFAFNSYYQKNPIPTSCDFGGNAVLTNVDPSTTSCQYPSMSTTSSLLNTSNQSGTRVFGSPPPNASVVAPGAVKLPVFVHVCIIMAVLTEPSIANTTLQ